MNDMLAYRQGETCCTYDNTQCPIRLGLMVFCTSVKSTDNETTRRMCEEHAVTLITNMTAVNLHVLVSPTNSSDYNDTVLCF